MSVAIVSFTPERLPALRALVEGAYPRPRSDAYFRWAYLGDAGHRAWLAMDGRRCLAVLRAFERPYLIDGRRTTCLETFDWYSAPDSRRQVAGLRVLRAAMDEGSTLVNVGGTVDTLAILPRLRWRLVDTASSYLLPLSSRAYAAAVPDARRGRRVLARGAMSVAVPAWFARGSATAPPGGEVEDLEFPGAEVLELYEPPVGYDLVPLPEPGHLRWLVAGLSSSSAFISLAFRIRGRLRGWGMARVYPGPQGPEVALLELFAPRPERSLYAWMASALVARARPRAEGTRPGRGR